MKRCYLIFTKKKTSAETCFLFPYFIETHELWHVALSRNVPNLSTPVQSESTKQGQRTVSVGLPNAEKSWDTHFEVTNRNARHEHYERCTDKAAHAARRTCGGEDVTHMPRMSTQDTAVKAPVPLVP